MQANNPSHACASVVVDELVRCGVTDAVLAPGSRSAALAIALHDDPRIRLHVEVDERSAGFLAIGIGRVTGVPAPVVVTSGSAVANLHPAVVEADTGLVPLLVLTADRPPELLATGANQAIDQVGIFGRAARWSVSLGAPEDRPGSVAYWRSTVDRAIAEATGLAGPPGPVQMNLAFREPTVPVADDGRSPVTGWSQPLDGRPDHRPWLRAGRARRLLSDVEFDDLAGRLTSVERGLVVVGSTTARSGPVHDLAHALGWPLVAESVSGVRTDGDDISTIDLLLAEPAFAAGHDPELVLRIGRLVLSRRLAELLGPQVPQILLDPDGVWNDPERSIGELLVADVDATCAALAERIGGARSSSWLGEWRAADRSARGAIADLLAADDVPNEPRTARDLAACLPEGTTLVVASSMPVRDLDTFMLPRDGLRIIANRGASGIDGFVSTTLGAALASGGPTVALTGDLSLLHDANGFLLAPATDRLDVVFVVVDNDGGGIFSFLPPAAFPRSFERVFGTPHGRDIGDLARFHRLGYDTVTRASDLGGAVASALEAGGIQVLHVRTDRRANAELHRRIAAEVGAALRDGGRPA